MNSFKQKNQDYLIDKLQKAGYSKSDIEHSFYTINTYREIEKDKSKKNKFKKLLDEITNNNSIFTYILKESLGFKISNWDENVDKRIASHNADVYKKVYIEYFNTAAKSVNTQRKIFVVYNTRKSNC